MHSPHSLTNEQWQQFQRDGFIKLGRLLPQNELNELQQRIDDIMLGKASVPYDQMLMQLDSTSGKYDDAGEQTKGRAPGLLPSQELSHCIESIALHDR